MGGALVRVPLYAMALATGGAFAVLFTGVAAGSFAGEDVLAAGGAFWTMAGAALVAALVGSAGRYRFVLLFPAAALYTVIAVYGSIPLFSLSGWRRFFFEIGTDVYEAANTMYIQPIPYDLSPGLFVVLIPVVMIVVTFATSATLYEESPVVSVAVLGLTIGVLSTISFEDGAGPFFALFLVSAVGLLLSSGSVGPEGPGRPALAAGVAVVALVLAMPKVPLSDATVSAGLIDWTRIGTGGTSRLDVQADVGDYLTTGREAELMRIQSPEPLLWRGGTLDFFDGVRWYDTVEPGLDDGEEISFGVETDIVRQRVEVLNAQTDLVFGGYKIGAVSEVDATRNSDSSWSFDEPVEEGMEYEVLSEIPQPTTSQLRGGGTAYPALIEEKFLQLPEGRPEVIAQTAQTIEQEYPGAVTPYDKARAVERYLVYDGGFAYDLSVRYRRADEAVEEFLGETKTGFCTQFATSMALILREMDVPSRVVYGSTEGRQASPGEYVVTGANMHTWVEAYFPGVGWYPFDPTPGFSMPTAMEANARRPSPSNPGAALGADPTAALRQQNIQQRQEQNALQQQQTPAERRNANASTDQDRVPVGPVLLIVAALLVAAVPLAKTVMRARGRPEDLYEDLAGRLRDVLAPGGAGSAVAGSPAFTPRERLVLLAGAAGVEEGPVRGFARAYTEHLYAAPGTSGGDDVSSAYRGAVRAYGRLPLWRRILGAFNPASLVSRVGRGSSARRAQPRQGAAGAATGVIPLPALKCAYGGVIIHLSRYNSLQHSAGGADGAEAGNHRLYDRQRGREGQSAPGPGGRRGARAAHRRQARRLLRLSIQHLLRRRDQRRRRGLRDQGRARPDRRHERPIHHGQRVRLRRWPHGRRLRRQQPQRPGRLRLRQLVYLLGPTTA